MPESAVPRRRCAVVGLGARAQLFTEALAGPYADRIELAGFCDVNTHRMAVHNDWIAADHPGQPPVPAYAAEDFDEMLRRERIDLVVVSTVDHLHDRYIVRALEAGCDVVTEKPMTTSADRARRILDTERRTGREVRVAFNYRYNPVHSAVCELLAGGEIGDIGSVHFEWLLDLRHGADYFRRWHRNKSNSGGLMVHKATHHFDPGRLVRADRPLPGRGGGGRLPPRPERVGPGVSIEDDMAVLVRYASGATLTYHLTAYAPWEGYRIAFNGSEGRVELLVEESTWTRPDVRTDGASPVMHGAAVGDEAGRTQLLVRRFWEEPREVKVPTGEGGHGGGDVCMLADLFGERSPGGSDPLGRAADARDGARSLVTGLAANESFATGLPVDVRGLRAA
ncbi:Gfo/Idh/MocA family oxidoreductase [Streptomyces sp. NPDC050844]|uniref:Gfo/Idh/MocA family protein n=1 Tax=Streptomyces sp. NPDC050844 TaxID=3155790 RepID=UPI0033D612BC